MRNPTLRFGQRFVVWVVATATAFESLVQAVDAAMDHRLSHVVLWMVACAVVFSMAFFVETLKSLRGD